MSFTVAKADTTASVTASPLGAINYGQTVTINGTVTGANTSISVGGTANVLDNAGASPWPGGGNLGVGVANGVVTALTVGPSSLFNAGTHPITVHYLGDSNYNPSPVSTAYSLVVNPAPSTTTLTSTSTSNLTIGSGPVVFTAKVAVLATAGNPPGTVTFFDTGSVPIPRCIGVAVTAANPAVATCSVTFDGSSAPKGGGNHSYTAVYTPTAATPQNYASSTSNAIGFSVTSLNGDRGRAGHGPGYSDRL